MSEQKKILFIVNPISGVGKKNTIPPLIKKHLDHTRLSHHIIYTTHRGHAHEIANAERENFDAIVAVGGDGSVNEIGSALINSACALAILPCGSGNGFARHAGIPLKLRHAVERINAFHPKKTDTGLVNDHVFLGTCGFGFDGYIAKKFDEFHTRGFFSYVKLVVREYRKYKAVAFDFTHNGTQQRRTALFGSVANSSQFGNGFTISPESDFNDGKFELVFLEKFSLTRVPLVAYRFFSKRIHRSSRYSSFSFDTDFSIQSSDGQPVHFHVDGEPTGASETFRIKIRPSSLMLL